MPMGKPPNWSNKEKKRIKRELLIIVLSIGIGMPTLAFLLAYLFN